MRKIFIFLFISTICFNVYAQEKYTIKKGDTLWDISGKFYEDNFKWPIIWKYNKYITNPDLIYPKENLMIPIIIKDGETIKLGSENIFKLSNASGEVERAAYAAEEVFRDFKKIKLNDYEIVLDELLEDKVIATQEGRDFVTTGNILRVSNKGDKFQLGERVVFLENIKKLKQAYLLKINGYGVVEKLDKGNAIVRIEKAFDSIGTGLYVMKKDYEDELALPVNFKEITTKKSGEIVYLSNNAVTSGDGYRAVIDLGIEDGIKVGDIVEIVRTTTEHGIKRDIKLGEAQVIYVYRNYATVKILSSILEIENGDLAKLVRVGIH
jgi:hypothetical protein